MTKYINIKEFKDKGYLQEVNRIFFHPLGLALQISWYENDDTKDAEIIGVLDYREDPEGGFFGEGMIDLDKVQFIHDEWDSRLEARIATGECGEDGRQFAIPSYKSLETIEEFLEADEQTLEV